MKDEGSKDMNQRDIFSIGKSNAKIFGGNGQKVNTKFKDVAG